MKTKLNFNMWIPTRILFGADELKNLHSQQMPGKKALLAISNGKSTRANGYLAATEEQLRLAGVESVVFDRIEANPLKSTVMAGAAAAREHGCDMIVALGGGSVMDAAKAIALMASNDGDLWDYVFGGTGKEQQAEHAPLPVVAVTTTAGTGSEVDPWGVVTNEQTHEKIGVEAAFPVLAVVDPKLMLTVPPKFTAYQGFDALFHSVESYISKFANLASDMYALTAIEHIARNLPRAVANGDDLEARTRVAFGNTLSGVVMCLSATTSQHSMEHAMSAYHQDLPHGARADHAQQGLLLVLHRPARLRRAFRTDGPCNGDGAGRTARGFHHGAHPLATGMRRRRPEDVRLRHHPRRVTANDVQRIRHNARTIRIRPPQAEHRRMHSHLPGRL